MPMPLHLTAFALVQRSHAKCVRQYYISGPSVLIEDDLLV